MKFLFNKEATRIVLLLSLVSLCLFSFNLVVAEGFGYNRLEAGEDLNPSTNFSAQNVNSSRYWNTTDLGAIDSVSDISYDDISGGDVDATGYTVTSNFLAGVIGLLSMDGDPWYLGGTDLEIALELLVRGVATFGNNIMPNQTLSWDIGSGAYRWRYLYVQNISADYADIAYDVNVLGNVNASYFIGDGSQLTGLPSVNSTAWNRTGTDVVLANTGDNVGIGTTSSGEKLEVAGNITYGTKLNSTENAIYVENTETEYIIWG